MSDTTILKVGTRPTILRATQGIPGPPGPPTGPPWREDEFTTTAGQVTFIISATPTDANSLSMYVNGVLYDDVAEFTISGTTITWLNTSFAMSVGDTVHVRYV